MEVLTKRRSRRQDEPRAPVQLAPSWLPRQQRRRIDRQLYRLLHRDVCSVCGSPFKHNSRTTSGLDAQGNAALTGECCFDRLAEAQCETDYTSNGATVLRAILNEALATIKAAGYRISKPKSKRKDRVGPTFVAEFADGTVTRRSTFTSLEKLDWDRGERLSQAAWQSRWRVWFRKQTGKVCPVDPDTLIPPVIVAARFEQDGKVLGTRP